MFPGNIGLRESCCASLHAPLLTPAEKLPAAPLKAIELAEAAVAVFVWANAIGWSAVWSSGVGWFAASSGVGWVERSPSGGTALSPSGVAGVLMPGPICPLDWKEIAVSSLISATWPSLSRRLSAAAPASRRASGVTDQPLP